MNKKILLLALAAVSAAVLALPAFASAEDTALHLEPTPSGAQTIDDVTVGNPTLTTESGTTVECDSFHGTANFNAGGTTGTMQLTFGGNCVLKGVLGGETCDNEATAGTHIVTTVLPFDLVTLPGEKPGVLVTPNSSVTNEHFATFTCRVFGFPVTTVVKGNGVIGTITNPKCGETKNEATIDFNATKHGFQEHTTVEGTETEYTLKKGEEMAAQDATGKLTLSSAAELVCS